MRSRTPAPRPRLRRRALLGAATAAVLALSACSGAASGPAGDGEAAPAPAADESLTLTVYSKFTSREYDVVTKGMESLKKKFPNITVKHEGNQDDDKLTASIRAGNPPDVAISFETDNLGVWCSNGSFQDVGPYLERDKIDLNVIPQAVRDYTEYEGNRCAMPMLTDVYGFYYNKELFAKAGLSGPPKTMSELFEYAKKLTEFNPDGSIKVAGFLPSVPFYASQSRVWAASFGVDWFDDQGKSNLAGSPQWTEMFRFQKKLVDFYGYDKMERFRAGLGDQFSADHAFQRGEIAMMYDAEYRTAFIDDQAPQLDYGTAPPPMADNLADRYGSALTVGTIIGIPKGAKNPGAAWELIKQLSLDTETLVQLGNGLHNVPSTLPALKHPGLKADEQFRTFLDIFASDKLVSTPTTPIGTAHLKAVDDFAAQWQAGKVPDLKRGLQQVDAQINDALAQK